jgi:alcohol dehydrogenase
VDTSSTAMLMTLMKAGVLDASRFITHRFDLGDMLEAYDVFGDARASHALKVVLTRS